MKAILTLGFVVVAFATFGRSELPATSSQDDTCNEQGRKALHGADREARRNGWQYVTNYDAATNICYVWVHQFTARNEFPHTEDRVFDPVNGETYAFYVWDNPKKQKYWDVPPTICVVNPRGGEQIVCNSSKEFGTLVEKYFGFRRWHHSW